MAEITTGANDRLRSGFGHQKKKNLRVDMTPMVDLGFILITFFVMTVQLGKPVTLNLIMPKEGGDPTPLGESSALTILLDDYNRVFYYHGKWEVALAKNEIYATSFSVKEGVGQIVREKQIWLDKHDRKEGRKGMMLLIKPGKNASYRNVIDALDEATINGVKKYALLSAGEGEKKWMTRAR